MVSIVLPRLPGQKFSMACTSSQMSGNATTQALELALVPDSFTVLCGLEPPIPLWCLILQ
jgi:hypothetical protein